MALYVYRISDGALVSWCPGDGDPVADDAHLAANGLAKVTGLPALDAAHSWDEANRAVKGVTPPAAPVNVPTWQFILLFTAAENAAIKSSADLTVQHFFDALRATQQVNLNDPIVQQGVGHLVTVGLLTSGNAALILSGQQSQ